MTRPLAMAVVLAMLASGPALAEETPDVAGLWLTEKKKVAVELYPCGDELCGKIAWLAKPRYSDGELKLDEDNPDPALRDRPWCGIEVIRGLERESGKWRDGKFYNPQDGSTYDLELGTRSDGTVKIRAYLGIKLLGKSEVWTRYEGEPPACETDA